MTAEEYRKFLEALFDHYVKDQIASVDKHQLLDNLKRLQQAVNALEKYRHRSPNLGQHELQELDRLFAELQRQVSFNEQLVRRTGIVNGLDQHLDQIAGDLDKGALPSFETDVLSRLHSRDPDRELFEARDEIRALANNVSEARIEAALAEADSRVAVERKKLRIAGWSGIWSRVEPIGKIFRGVGIAGFNVAAGCGILPALGISVTSLGPFGGAAILLSVINGLGLLIEGTGKLKSMK
jgi:hypothetical protein